MISGFTPEARFREILGDIIMQEQFTFLNAKGEKLAGRLELPEIPTKQAAIFAHCFTCGKDILGAPKISRELAKSGLAVLRFDFTGLGASQGNFAETHFSSNVDDLVRAARALSENGYTTHLLVGHSLGGAAVLAAAEQIPEAKGIVTIGAPVDPQHVEHLFGDNLPKIEEGEAEIDLAGRPITIRKEFLEDIRSQSLEEKIHNLGRALLVFHSPVDNTVGIENAAQIYRAARHPKSFVSLDHADHLITEKSDAIYIAQVLSAWATRYLNIKPNS